MNRLLLAAGFSPPTTEQLTWAWGSSGEVLSQPKAQLYLNTANPGEVRDQVTTWPSTGGTPYGTCDGGNTMACSCDSRPGRCSRSSAGVR